MPFVPSRYGGGLYEGGRRKRRATGGRRRVRGKGIFSSLIGKVAPFLWNVGKDVLKAVPAAAIGSVRGQLGIGRRRRRRTTGGRMLQRLIMPQTGGYMIPGIGLGRKRRVGGVRRRRHNGAGILDTLGSIIGLGRRRRRRGGAMVGARRHKRGGALPRTVMYM